MLLTHRITSYNVCYTKLLRVSEHVFLWIEHGLLRQIPDAYTFGRPRFADDRLVERAQQSGLLVLGRDGEHADFRNALIGSVVDAASYNFV